MIKIGDVFEIPLKGERKAYGQYVFKDKNQGPLVQIFDIIGEDTIPNLDDIRKAKPLFPPVITGINAAIRTGMWHIIGRLPIEDFVYPKFVSAHYDEKTGEAYCWFLWDGKQYSRIGIKLPKKYKHLEYLGGWSPYDVVDRIETGKYPYPYGDLIKHNKFIPLEIQKNKPSG
ncbi:MAG: immunity 26/phosphotriesterase HocA family protein [Anaerolineaceae bacterium]|nr:immunity 26/phosphotriesterase HocA family protein [Anaerolineaceae bacterium]